MTESAQRDELFRAFLAERHQLLGFAFALAHDYHIAEDILQDVWMQLVKSIDAGRPPEHLAGWCRRVIRNRSVDHFRKHHRERPSEHLVELVDRAFDEAQSADDTIWQDRRNALRQCLDDTPAHNRTVLAMRYRDGLTSAKIAAQLGRSMEAVKKQITRLRQSLECCIRQRLQGQI